MNGLTEKQESMCARRFMRENAFLDLKRLRASSKIVENAKALAIEIREKLEADGINQEMYDAFCKEYLPIHEEMIRQENKAEKCLNWLKHLQRNQDDCMCECMERLKGCKEDCPEFIEATEEQISRHYHGFNIETNEKLDLEEYE